MRNIGCKEERSVWSKETCKGMLPAYKLCELLSYDLFVSNLLVKLGMH